MIRISFSFMTDSGRGFSTLVYLSMAPEIHLNPRRGDPQFPWARVTVRERERGLLGSRCGGEWGPSKTLAGVGEGEGEREVRQGRVLYWGIYTYTEGTMGLEFLEER